MVRQKYPGAAGNQMQGDLNERYKLWLNLIIACDEEYRQ